MKLPGKNKTKKLTTHLICTLMCFLFFFQANLILVPFPTNRKQVLSVCLRVRVASTT